MSTPNFWKNAVVGKKFRLYADSKITVEKLKAKALKKVKLVAHFKCCIGPPITDESRNTMSYPIEVVDDPFLEGEFKNLIMPPKGCKLYLGYFKAPK